MDSPKNTMKNTMTIPRNTTSFCHDQQIGTGFLKYFEGPHCEKNKEWGWVHEQSWFNICRHVNGCGSKLRVPAAFR
jgi:hypothetical protein